jgi:hypothetical protein
VSTRVRESATHLIIILRDVITGDGIKIETIRLAVVVNVHWPDAQQKLGIHFYVY